MSARVVAPGVTVLGNVAIDRIDGAGPTAGGAPSFVGSVLAQAGGGRIVARAAGVDLPLFDDVVAAAGVPFDVLPAQTTSAFGMTYDGDDRRMTVDAIGPRWDAADVAAAAVTTAWAHVAALLRTDFTPRALATLGGAGVHVAYDGQGLVRVPELGDLRTDAGFDPELLRHVDVLKLADDEAAVLTAGAPFDAAAAATLGVREIVLTAGSHGSTLFLAGDVVRVPPPFRVEGVHATGAGDSFTVAYVGARSRGESPADAARFASQVVAELLAVRRELS
ncbi:MAG: PfkB family carbohydrate kinase [Patulibacter minatonensis]